MFSTDELQVEPLRTDGRLLGYASLLCFGLLVGGLTFLIRLVFPVDTWIDILGFIGTESAHFPQYALMLIFGIPA